MLTLARLLLLTVLIFVAGSASAATLNVVGGVLVGAYGVNIGGAFYDVSFVDGTCIGVFSGCDQASDFTFTTVGSASDAGQVLLDEVFIDVPEGDFDSDPSLIAGCATTVCSVVIPHALESGGTSTRGVWAKNDSSEIADQLLGRSLSTSIDTSTEDARVYAVFSPAPTPVPTMSLAALSLLVAVCVALGLIASAALSKDLQPISASNRRR